MLQKSGPRKERVADKGGALSEESRWRHELLAEIFQLEIRVQALRAVLRASRAEAKFRPNRPQQRPT
jgi:hypothetical protein